MVSLNPFAGLPQGGALGAIVIDTDGNDSDGFAVVGGDMLYGEAGDDNIWAGYQSAPAPTRSISA